MKVVAINGSPRKNGNTKLLLEAVLQPLRDAGWQAELIQVGGLPIQGCRACGKCIEKQNQRCICENDICNEVLAKMFAANAMILGSPCYFTDMTAEMKALIDRAGFVAYVNGGLLKGKIGAAVVAARRGGATHVYDSINHMFMMSKMLIPGSSYWNIGYGLNEKEVANDEEAMANMRQLGSAVAWLGKAIEPHLSSYPD